MSPGKRLYLMNPENPADSVNFDLDWEILTALGYPRSAQYTSRERPDIWERALSVLYYSPCRLIYIDVGGEDSAETSFTDFNQAFKGYLRNSMLRKLGLQ